MESINEDLMIQTLSEELEDREEFIKFCVIVLIGDVVLPIGIWP